MSRSAPHQSYRSLSETYPTMDDPGPHSQKRGDRRRGEVQFRARGWGWSWTNDLIRRACIYRIKVDIRMLLRVGHEALASTHSRFRVCSAQGEVYWVEPKYVVAKHILRATGRKCCIRWASCETCWKPRQAWRHFDVCRDTRVNRPPCESRNKISFLTCSNDWYNPTRPTQQSVAPILCPMTTAFWPCCLIYAITSPMKSPTISAFSSSW